LPRGPRVHSHTTWAGHGPCPAPLSPHLGRLIHHLDGLSFVATPFGKTMNPPSATLSTQFLPFFFFRTALLDFSALWFFLPLLFHPTPCTTHHQSPCTPFCFTESFFSHAFNMLGRWLIFLVFPVFFLPLPTCRICPCRLICFCLYLGCSSNSGISLNPGPPFPFDFR